MDRRRTTKLIAANVSRLASEVGDPAEVVARATGLPLRDATDRLAAKSEFGVTELAQVGGLLRVSPAQLLDGAYA